jgi:hypothetical protein
MHYQALCGERERSRERESDCKLVEQTHTLLELTKCKVLRTGRDNNALTLPLPLLSLYIV